MYGSISGTGSGGNNGGGTDTDYGGVGFQGPSTSGTFDSAQFLRLCDNITSNVFAITKHGESSHISAHRSLQMLGTICDSYNAIYTFFNQT